MNPEVRRLVSQLKDVFIEMSEADKIKVKRLVTDQNVFEIKLVKNGKPRVFTFNAPTDEFLRVTDEQHW